MSAPGTTNNTEERALKLLGSGVGPEQTAAALGITPARISQLLSTESFVAKVAELRFQSLSKHNDRDDEYDSIEDKLIDKLKDCIDFMTNPMQILKCIQVINSAKRRGVSTPEQITNQQTVINLTIPSILVQKFTTNINNQVIQTGEQKLVTIQSGTLVDKLKGLTSEPQRALPNREAISSTG
jgi:hypothetical protein